MWELEVAREAARAGGEIINGYFRSGDVRQNTKQETYDLVSQVDVEAEQAVAGVIRRAFPGHEVLGEESHRGDPGAERLWIIDPLDGTNNFAHHIPHFAVSVAYYHRGEPQCGVIYNPVRDDWYIAARGQGAEHNGQSVQVADQSRLDQALIGVGFYYDRGAMMEATLAAIRDLFGENIHGIRRMGTASLDLANVGTGSFGAYFEYELSPWDFAAGRLFVEEAGGRVTTCAGQPLPLAKTSVLASNGLLHDAMLAIVRRHWPPS